MVSAARDRLASMLRGDVKSASSVQFTARPEELSVEVDGHGPVRFPVTPAKARKLIQLASPARFGRGEETVTDPNVRDTWEIPRELVHPAWNAPMLNDILATIKEELGLPNGAELTADLHSLLVYEPNQFFLPHQDSEKDDAMVGTLVVTLPSTYSGGELKVGHNEEWQAYHGSKTALSLVAFYADCQHEVLPVKSGYRITLTYNLLLHGDTSRPETEEGKVAEAISLLREHFATPAPRYAYGEPTDPPNRLVYLLDHEYTPRALSWDRLKGADAARASLLQTAAEQADCEAILALADVKTSHGAFPEERGYGYRRRWDWDADYADDEDEAEEEEDYDFSRSTLRDTRNFQIQELLYSEVTLTHWTGPDGRRLDETSLLVSDGEVCASTEDGDLAPYAAEYEGYMGNWGNTLDRWYHRVAIVVWPRSQAFANRAETSPAWALDELTAMAAAGRVSEARDAAATLERFWGNSVRALTASGKDSTGTFLERTLRTATAIADGQVATMLLRPFRVELLAETHADAFAAAADGYGRQWTTALLRGWFDDSKSSWAFADPGRLQWLADRLPGLTRTLDAAGGEAAGPARLLLDLSWAWLAETISNAIADPSPSHRDSLLDELGKPLAVVLTSAAALQAANLVDAVCAHVTKQPDVVTVLEGSALRAAAASWRGKRPSTKTPGRHAWAALAADCAARLRARLELPLRADDDWSIELPDGGCICGLCSTLTAFLSHRERRVLEWPLAEQGRHHVHERIERAELPVAHETRRTGRPYTLVLTKTDDLFTRERTARDAADADLKWLADHGLL